VQPYSHLLGVFEKDEKELLADRKGVAKNATNQMFVESSGLGHITCGRQGHDLDGAPDGSLGLPSVARCTRSFDHDKYPIKC